MENNINACYIPANRVRDYLKRNILVDGLNIIIDFEKSTGSWLVDKTSGKKYLDCFGQFASLPIGYNHPALLKEQHRIHNAALCKVVNSDLYSCEYASFVDTLFKHALPKDFKYAFFIEGGSAAVENSLKVAFDWKSKKLNLPDAFSKNLDIIHLQEAFHGRGGYTLSLTNTGTKKTDHFPRFDWTRILNPKIDFKNVPQVESSEKISLKQAETALKRGNVAAIIVEPVQGEGGNNMFRGSYLKDLHELATKYEALFICDEIQTGFGASGKWWCYEHFDIVPDILVFGKKSQVCGIAATDKMNEVKDHCFTTPGRINSTWGGNIVDMIRCDIIINIIQKEELIENAHKVGSYLLAKLREIEAVSALISNTRGVGTLVAFDLPDAQKRNEFLSKLKEDMLILSCGERSIRFRPALTFSKDDVDIAIQHIRRNLR